MPFPSNPTIWHNVPARVAQAADGGPLDALGTGLGDQLAPIVQRAIQEYLHSKGDARVADLLRHVQLVLTVSAGAFVVYLLSKTGGRR